MGNRELDSPLPTCLRPLFQGEAWCIACADETPCTGLDLKMRLKTIRKWPLASFLRGGQVKSLSYENEFHFADNPLVNKIYTST